MKHVGWLSYAFVTHANSQFLLHLHCKEIMLPESGFLLSVSILCVVTLCGLVSRYQDTNASEEYTLSIFTPEDGGSMLLRNVGIYFQVDSVLKKNNSCIYIVLRV
jgi:hypothetical protein